MAPKPTKDDEIVKLLTQLVADKEGKKEDASRKKAAAGRKKVAKGLVENTVGLLGLTKSMFTLAGLAGDQKAMNAKLSQNLGQVALATNGSQEAMKRFAVGQQGAQQAIDSFSDAVGLGMTKFSNSTLQFAAHLKLLGVQNKAAMGLMRANTQGLGISQEVSLQLADSLVSTAAANKDSIEGLISAINSMKEAMTKTTVELGPKASANAQKIAAMMSQGNSELQETSAKFVSSFLAGSDGYMKAAKLGVQFTGQESTAEMAAKFEEILGKISTLQEGKAGAGSQFMFDALEKSFGLSREDFNLQKQIGTEINSLVAGNTQQLAAQTSQISLQQAYDNATFAFQTKLLEMTEGAASMISGLGEKIGGWLIPIMAGIGMMAGLMPTMMMKLGKGLIMLPFKIGKFFTKGLNKLGSGLANKIFGVKTAIMKTSGKTVAGAAAKSAVKSGSAVAVQKGIFKGLVKKIPLIGAIAGAGFAISRAVKGDMAGAAMELASGVASTIPGLGTAASVGIDAALMARDMKKAADPTGTVHDGTAGGAAAASVAAEGDDWKQASLEVQKLQADTTEKTKEAVVHIAKNTKDSLDIQRSQLESKSSDNPMYQISNQLAMNMLAMNDLIGLTSQANDQRIEQTETLTPELVSPDFK